MVNFQDYNYPYNHYIDSDYIRKFRPVLFHNSDYFQTPASFGN